MRPVVTQGPELRCVTDQLARRDSRGVTAKTRRGWDHISRRSRLSLRIQINTYDAASVVIRKAAFPGAAQCAIDDQFAGGQRQMDKARPVAVFTTLPAPAVAGSWHDSNRAMRPSLFINGACDAKAGSPRVDAKILIAD